MMQRRDLFINPVDGTHYNMTNRSKHLLGEGFDFTQTLDRSALGRFAVDPIALMWLDIFNRNYMLVGSEQDRKEVDRLSRRATDHYDVEMKQNARLEASFWRYRNCGGNDYTFANHTRQQWRHLEVVADSPIEYHDYFAVGIWDSKDVTRFISEGIDAELAKAVAR